jgi:fumarate reductase flavoprotein subunit
MEFVQYHPTGLPDTGILITEACRGEGGILVNKDGYRYLQDYELGEPLELSDAEHPQKRTMELGPRDRLSQAFVHERRKGRTIETEHGHVVHLDVRHLGEKRINKKIPFVRELCLKYVGIDPVHEPIPVRPVVHYFMGGIATDINAATTLPGLYAAGECACVNINGANRLGSNSLTELLVFGARAGKAAAEFALQQPDVDEAAVAPLIDKARAELARFTSGPPNGDRVADIRDALHQVMEDSAGIYRDEESLSATCQTIATLKERFLVLRIEDQSVTYNTELSSAVELGFVLDVAEALAHSALARKESRGSHQRTDFPDRNDKDFLKHSLAYYTGGAPRIEYSDVVVTKWPPGERKYGAESGLKRTTEEGEVPDGS